MLTLSKTLNDFLRPTPTKRKPSGRYVAVRGDVRAVIAKDRNGLWSVTIAGSTYSNSLLRDLKSQVADLGFDVLAEQPK